MNILFNNLGYNQDYLTSYGQKINSLTLLVFEIQCYFTMERGAELVDIKSNLA